MSRLLEILLAIEAKHFARLAPADETQVFSVSQATTQPARYPLTRNDVLGAAIEWVSKRLPAIAARKTALGLPTPDFAKVDDVLHHLTIERLARKLRTQPAFKKLGRAKSKIKAIGTECGGNDASNIPDQQPHGDAAGLGPIAIEVSGEEHAAFLEVVTELGAKGGLGRFMLHMLRRFPGNKELKKLCEFSTWDAKPSRPAQMRATESPRKVVESKPNLVGSTIPVAEEKQPPSAEGASRYESRVPESVDVSAESVEAQMILRDAPADHSKFEFRKRGTNFEISAFGESGIIRGTKGMRQIHRLIQSPGRSVAYLDLDEATEAEKHRASADKRSRQPVLDGEAVSKYRLRLQELKQDYNDANAACNDREAERLSLEIDSIEANLIENGGFRGKGADLNNAVNDKLRSKIAGTLGTAYKNLRESKLFQTAAHFESAIASDGTGTSYRYSPACDPQPDWKV